MLTMVHEPDTDLLLRRVARHLCRRIREALALRDSVNIAVPGGRSVAKVFEAMRAEEVDWIAYAFLRCRRAARARGSSGQQLQDCCRSILSSAGAGGQDFALTTPIPLSSTPRCRIGKRAYEAVLARHGFRFDIVLLSSGEDGHVGALFPDHHCVTDPRITASSSCTTPPSRLPAA
jgi:6-phosphogluconolactonase